MRNSISHPKNDFEGIHSHIPTKLLCLSPEKKKNVLVKLLYYPVVPHMRELKLARGILAQKMQPLLQRGRGNIIRRTLRLRCATFFLKFLEFGSFGPLPKTVLGQKCKTATYVHRILTISWPKVHKDNHATKEKCRISDDFGLRSSVIQKNIFAKKRYTSIIACVM